MRERDRLSAIAHRQELEAEQRAEQERIEAPIRAAEKELNANTAKLIEIQRENILKLKDENVFLGELAGAGMTQDAAIANNQKAVDQFLLECHEYRDKFRTDENRDVLLSYLDRNSVNLWSVPILRAAFTKLRDLGLLTERPPEPEPLPVPDTPEIVEEPAPTGPTMHEGVDIETGLPRTYTKREVDRMSADTFRRAFLVSSESLRLPIWGPGPKGLINR